MQTLPGHIYEFGAFQLDSAKRLLRRTDGTPVPLTARVFEALLYMVEHHDAVLDKERMMEVVWPDSIVEENNLAQAISKLRQVFGETPGSHSYIVTVPGRGYRFVAEVSERTAAAAPNANTQHATSPTPVQRSTDPGLAIERYPRPAKTGWLLAAAVSAIAIVSLASLFFFRHRTYSSSPPTGTVLSAPVHIPERSVAVLPFENLSDDKQNSYFAAGVQDEILSDLARIADLKVISRTSANHYKSGNVRNSREIGQQLGVGHLLEGSVQRIGDRLRVHAQLIDARTDTDVWAQTYDRDVSDLFAIQSEIAQAIAAQLRAKISPTERAAIEQPPTTDLIANALYAQARLLEGKEPLQQSFLQAVRLLDEAVARDTHFPLAYCLLGKMHLYLFFMGYDHTPARRELANAAIQNAVRLQPEFGEVHLALARYAYWGFWDYERARAELDIARRTLPNDAELCLLTGQIDRRQGRWAEAIKNFERAIDLDPRNLQFLGNAGGAYESLRRYSESSRLFERAFAISPRAYLFRWLLACQPFYERADVRTLREELSAIRAEQPEAVKNENFADLLFRCAMAERDPAAVNRALAAIPAEGLLGVTNLTYPREWFAGLAARAFNNTTAAHTSFIAARAIAEKLVPDQSDYAPIWSLLGQIDAALGRKDDAIHEGRRACELLPVLKDAVVGPSLITNLAMIYAWTGEKDLALKQLAISTQLRAGVTYGGLKLDPEWDALRGDPRFEKIVASLAPKH